MISFILASYVRKAFAGKQSASAGNERKKVPFVTGIIYAEETIAALK
jgi:hypothetical protein